MNGCNSCACAGYASFFSPILAKLSYLVVPPKFDQNYYFDDPAAEKASIQEPGGIIPETLGSKEELPPLPQVLQIRFLAQELFVSTVPLS